MLKNGRIPLWLVATVAGTGVLVVVACYRDWETDRKSTRLNSSHRL